MQCLDIAKTILNIMKMDNKDRHEALRKLPVRNQDFRRAVEKAFPEPDIDISTQLLFDMARLGRWDGWRDRILRGFSLGDSSVTSSAIAAISKIDPQKALSILPPMLMDSCAMVRKTTAQALSSLPSGEGIRELGKYLREEPDEDRKHLAVYSGIRASGSSALTHCILDNEGIISIKTAGRLLDQGIDVPGIRILMDNFPDNNLFLKLIEATGDIGKTSVLAAWPLLNAASRRMVLSSLISSDWALRIPAPIPPDLSEILKNMSQEERKELLEPALKNTNRAKRRQLLGIIRS